MQTFRVVANQCVAKLHVEIAYLRFQKIHVGQTLTYQEAVMIAEAIPFQRCDDFWNLSLYRPTSKLCHLLSCGMPFSKAFAGRPNTGTVFSPRQTPPRSQMGSHDLPSRYLAGVVSKTFLLSVPLFRIEASPRPCLSLTFLFTCNTRSR